MHGATPPWRNLSSGTLKFQLSNYADYTKLCKDQSIELVDCCFCDPLGSWVHQSFAPEALGPNAFTRGLPFDGSAIKLFCTIDQSDMLMVPDLSTAWIDPFLSQQTGVNVLHFTCCIKDPTTDKWFDRDPRTIAKRAVQVLLNSGVADDALFAPVTEFFVFDSVSYHTKTNSAAYAVDANEGYWNSNKSGDANNHGLRVGPQQWYLSGPPMDTLFQLRTEMALIMKKLALEPIRHHHDVATSQCEIGYKHASLVESADQFMLFKYVVRNVAGYFGKSASFLPKPIYGDHGSGMHVHQSLWQNGKPIFYGNGPAGLSGPALLYIGGLLRHAPALTAFTNPTTNSYKRLVPGFEAPVNLVYSAANRSAAIRIPMYYPSDPSLKRIEFRVPDPTCNPYLAFAAQLLAGLDGIINKINPGNPLDMDIYELSAEEKENLAITPVSLGDALSALEADSEFLLAGDVFNREFLDAYITYKRTEISRLETAPHPLEFDMYYHL